MIFRKLLVLIILPTNLIIAQTTAELDSIAQTIDFSTVVVTAQYAPTHSKNSVHPVKVIRAEEIQQQGQNNLAEVLANQLNLRVNSDPILGNGLRIQGIGGENIQVLIDGVPVIGRVDGNIDLSQINLNNVDRIEIIEGAMSAQYGSNASGGVINIITKKSQLNRFQIESQNQYEDIGIWNNAFSVGARFGDFFGKISANCYLSQFAPDDSLRLYETITNPDGTSFQTKVNPWNPKMQYGVEALLRYHLSDSITLSYQYRTFEEELTIFGQERRPQFRPYAFDDFYYTDRQDHNFNIEAYVGSKFYLNSTTAYNDYARTNETIRLDFEPDTTSLVPGSQDTTEFTALLHRSILSTTSKKALNGQAGLEIYHETGTGGRIIDSTSTPLNKAVLSNYALWGSLQYRLTPEIIVQGNLRYGYNTKYDHPLIPSINASWKIRNDLSLKASYAHGFRAPSLKELHFNFIDINHYIIGNPDLEAEYSKNAAITIEHEKAMINDQVLTISAKLFYNKIRNRIVLTEFAAVQFNYQNLDNFETHGLNLQLSYALGERLLVKSGYAYTRLFNFWSEDYETNKFSGLSEMQNELHVLLPEIETKLLLTHRFIGRQIRFYQNEADEIEEGFIGDYHLMNLTLSRSFWKNRIFLALGSKNLLDIQTVPLSGGQSDGAHSSVGNSQLLNWGRTYFVRLNITI